MIKLSRRVAVGALGAFLAWSAAAQERFIVVASTTSTEQSGLFGHLLPLFKQASGIEVRALYVA